MKHLILPICCFSIVLPAYADTCGGLTHPNISANPSDFGLVPSDFTAVCQITTQGIANGFIEDNLTLTSNVLWVLNGAVNIGLSVTGGAQNPIVDPNGSDAAVLTVEAGTTIIGDYNSTNGLADLDYLIVNRGSRLIANGSASQPIRFTSRQAMTGETQVPGQWGGIVINGYARVNNCSSGDIVLDCESAATIGGGQYGGNDDTDSSGELRYVRVENAGFQLTSDAGFAGLSFNGVGTNTTVDSIQVNRSEGNGVNVTGGTVKFHHIVLTDSLKNALTWSNGWNGIVEKLLVITSANGGSAIDGSNHEQNSNALPQSNPIVVNSTIISASSDTAVKLKDGTGVAVYTQVISSPSGNCYLHDGAGSGNLTISHSRIDCNSVGSSQVEADWFGAGQYNSAQLDVDLNGYINGRSLAGATLFNLPKIEDVEHAGHIGAIGSCIENWAELWTVNLPEVDSDLCFDPSVNVPIGNLFSFVLPAAFVAIAAKR